MTFWSIVSIVDILITNWLDYVGFIAFFYKRSSGVIVFFLDDCALDPLQRLCQKLFLRNFTAVHRTSIKEQDGAT